ncbi:MAG: hypothetical protein WC602_05885 [archaeon]
MKGKEDWLSALEDFTPNLADLSKDADLSIALMNIISIEEHLEFSFSKTQDEKYLSMLESVRGIRKELLKKLVSDPAAEEWCISKHLLAASMRLYEVGTKELDAQRKEEAANLFNLGYELYSMFFALNAKTPARENFAQEKILLPGEIASKGIAGSKNRGFSQRAREIVKKIVDCCRE